MGILWAHTGAIGCIVLLAWADICVAELATWGVGPDVYTSSKGKIVPRNVIGASLSEPHNCWCLPLRAYVRCFFLFVR